MIIFFDKTQFTMKSSIKLVFLLSFIIIASDLSMKSEAQHPTPGRGCRKNSDCKHFCPTCPKCTCADGMCLCNPPVSDNIYDGAPPIY
uniref:Uncharacterized protein n=1 Tax=Cajanus cajan TaxID=3821 RepID=A0A151RC94_CAJCA|nr:hypothetical protein KK1_038525 [Cajanus cajan]KYP40157.1 hypothetical protein KK1_038526 [Cajanus cajan]